MRNNCSKKLFTLVKNNLIDKYIYIFSLKIKKVSLQRVNQFVKVLAYISSNIKFPKINRPRNRYIDTSRGIEVNSVRSNPLEQNGGISELSIIIEFASKLAMDYHALRIFCTTRLIPRGFEMRRFIIENRREPVECS